MGSTKTALLESLADREKIALAFLLSKSIRPIGPRQSLMSYFEQINPKTLFGFLCKKCFGDWDNASSAMNRILGNIDRVKQVLEEVFVDKDFLEERAFAGDICPKMPKDLVIENSNIGEASVTFHAWRRFWFRFYRTPFESKLIKELKYSFARATPDNLKRGPMIERIINNEFKPASYFFDKKLDCRFVVISEDNKRILVTVEHPFPS